jgi:Putative addiction module component
MARALPVPPPGFDALSIEDRIDYVAALWDRVTASSEAVPVPAWHLEILEERLAAEEGEARSWSEVRADLQAALDLARK